MARDDSPPVSAVDLVTSHRMPIGEKSEIRSTSANPHGGSLIET
jgi:hypothetical protein